MTHQEIREKFIKYFESKGHKAVSSSSLLPENDPTTLFTGSGMQPILPYLLGEKHPLGTRIVNSQKCFRAEDIEEVGDNRHTTFFEMLGNWSFGDYWKEEQLAWIFEFITEQLKLDPSKIYVTVFSGIDSIGRDDESIKIWQELFQSKNIQDTKYALLGTLEEASQKGMNNGERIFGYGYKNWWSRTGSPKDMPAGEPGGPDSEIFYDFGTSHDSNFGEKCHPNCDCGRFLEIGNSVFMEYRKKTDGDFEKLPQRNVDFGGGLERMTAASENRPDIFETSVFNSIIASMPTANTDVRRKRIIADHSKASFFLINDGVLPSNKGAGYILRRLLRRLIVQTHLGTFGSFQGMDTLGVGILEDMKNVYQAVEKMYKNEYPDIEAKLAFSVFEEEFKKFNKVFKQGLTEIKKLEHIDTQIAFKLYESFGLTYEIIKDVGAEKASSLRPEEFEAEREKHREISRAGVEKKFGGHGMKEGEPMVGDTEETKKKTRLHTATHVVVASLEKVLGEPLKQAGADITTERLRFDFAFPRKVTPEELAEAEKIANQIVVDDLEVWFEELPLEEAFASGAHGAFAHKYPPRVNIYTIGPKENYFSREICGGPHVSHTGEIGHIKIIKEESVSGSNRRIRATIE